MRRSGGDGRMNKTDGDKHDKQIRQKRGMEEMQTGRQQRKPVSSQSVHTHTQLTRGSQEQMVALH